MSFTELVSFDIRKTYLKESQLKSWEEQNRLYRTLWFANEVGGPDVEFCQFSVDIFKLYSFYSNWDKIDRKNGGYILKKINKFDITADLMNVWWYLFKKFIRSKKRSKRDIIRDVVEQIREIKENELVEQLMEKYNRDEKTCKALLKFLDCVYTIGNISPAGCNKGGGGYDFWDRKLELLKDNWFNISYQNREKIYEAASEKMPRTKTYIEKWAPFLWGSFTKHHDQDNDDTDWNNFICKNYYQDYVDEKNDISPLLNLTGNMTTLDDKKLYEMLEAVRGRIEGRGKKIIEDMPNNESEECLKLQNYMKEFTTTKEL